MTDPVISPDGKSMWTGEEWIPITTDSNNTLVSLHDSVVTGDINTEINYATTINKKIITMIIVKTRYLFISKPNKNSVSKVGVPNLAKTAPKKFDAATKTIISAVISKVLTNASCNFGNVNFL